MPLKIMGLDLGTKRIGVALSDDLGLTAQGLTVIPFKGEEDFLTQVQALIQEHNVNRIVVGLPRRMDGSLGPEAKHALGVAERLRNRLNMEVVTWDERLSTAAAERVLIQADLSRKKRKKIRDKVAAAYILQGYMDYISLNRTEEA